MEIRAEEKEIFNERNGIVDVIIGKDDIINITVAPADIYVSITSYDGFGISIEGGETIIESVPLPQKGSLEFYKEISMFILSGNVLDIRDIHYFSIPIVLRIVMQLLDNNKMGYTYSKSDKVETLSVESDNQEFFEQLVKHCIQSRCSKDVDSQVNCILRQLPMRVASEESSKLISIGKKHAIYKSERGGYNIKVKDYTNDTLDHYSTHNSNMWD